jgi:hypothetical protein
MSPSSFVGGWIPVLAARVAPPRRALDLAMGRGRHALALARNGFHTFGVDVKHDAVRRPRRPASASADGARI